MWQRLIFCGKVMEERGVRKEEMVDYWVLRGRIEGFLGIYGVLIEGCE
jgi:hypothetical protein